MPHSFHPTTAHHAERPKVVLFANTEWYLYNFRLPLARHLRALGYDVLLLSPPGPYGQRLREQGFRWKPTPLRRRSLNPVGELLYVLGLARLLRAERPTLVHNFTLKCVIYGSLAARGAARVNAVAGLGYVFTSPELRARLLRPFVRRLIQFAVRGRRSRVILQNTDDANLFAAFRLAAPERIRLVRSSGVDCSLFTPPQRRRPGPLRVLLAARLLREKGVVEFAEAARRLKAEGRAIEFLLAGDPDPGNPGALSETDVRAWADEGLLTWLGHVDDMPRLMRSVDVVALPTFYGEGVPKTLIEGAAAGRALVATDVPGCREVIESGVDGLLIPPRSADALANAIAALDDEPPLRARFGKAARAKAVAQFDHTRVLRQTVEVYQELLGPTPEVAATRDVLIPAS